MKAERSVPDAAEEPATVRVMLISNRVPVPGDTLDAGGLVVTLQDALGSSGGTWFGWDGEDGSARATEPAVVEDDGVSFATVPLSEHDMEHYYRGYANSVLWPLFHERLDALVHRESFYEAYVDVNDYFADLAAPSIEQDDIVWVQDYHLLPMGAALRLRGVTGRIGFFLHTPFPPWDVFRALPEARALLGSMFAYDLVGLQTRIDTAHFADALRRSLGARVDEARGEASISGGRTLRFGPFPVGLDPEETAAEARESRYGAAGRRIDESMDGRALIVGADRLDYTKGLVQRLRGFDRLIERYGDDLGDRFLYVQIAAPSRENVRGYPAIARRLETEAGRINGRVNRVDWAPLRLIKRSVPRRTLLGYLSLARVGLVTPLRDGMNLVAKEFIAAQPPEDPGVLVLSSLAGAAEELRDAALIVNPYDAAGVADGLYRALTMPEEERRRRHRVGMERLRANTATHWRDRFLGLLRDPDSPVSPEPRELRGAPGPRGPRPSTGRSELRASREDAVVEGRTATPPPRG